MTRLSTAQALQLAMDHHRAGRLAQAESLYRQILAVSPNDVSALHLLGVLAQQCGHAQQSVQLITAALRISPNDYAMLSNLGESLRATGRHDEAAAALEKALALEPKSATVMGNLGLIYADRGDTKKALALYEQALAIDPDHTRTLNNLANLHSARGRYESALQLYERAIAIDPHFSDAFNNRGTALERLERLEESMAAYQRAIDLNPGFAIAWNNLGNVLRRLNRWSEAVERFERALSIKRDFAEARWNLTLVQLTHGNYQPWLADYELRFVATPHRLPADIDRPRWQGEPLTGRTMLVFAEQGLGDGWMAARYLPALKALGARIIVCCHRAQLSLMRRLESAETVVAFGQPRPPHDFFEPMMSLPFRLGSTLATLPRTVPYLDADPQRVEAWHTRLQDFRGLKVGLVWRGSDTPDPQRSIPLARLAPLAAIEGINYFSLQFGPAAGDVKQVPAWRDMIDLSADVADFGETAACMMNLDLIISADTAAAHLAGALGRRVWTLLPFSPDWRWMIDRADTPWYPTMRLFRQRERGDWSDVVKQVGDQLRLIISPPQTVR